MSDIKERKLAERKERIHNFTLKYKKEYENIDIKLKDQILNFKAHEIYKNICVNKTYSSRTVLLIFCFASIEAHQRTNCLTEIMFDQAFLLSEELDRNFKESGQPKGPLHGVPFSIKDTFDIKGFGKI